MDHGKRPYTIHEPLVPEPCEKFLPIRCGENRLQRVFRTNCRDLFRHGKEEEIVVAQDGDGPISKVLDVAKDAQRVRATIDQIADEPEAIGPPCEAFWTVHAVFVGRVLATAEQPSQPWKPGEPLPSGLGVKVTLAVVERLSGESGDQPTIEITTGRGGGDCGYRFEVGRDYVV